MITTDQNTTPTNIWHLCETDVIVKVHYEKNNDCHIFAFMTLITITQNWDIKLL